MNLTKHSPRTILRNLAIGLFSTAVTIALITSLFELSLGQRTSMKTPETVLFSNATAQYL